MAIMMADYMAMNKRVSIAEAKNEFTSLVREAEAGKPIDVTRRGKRVAVLMSADAAERLTNAAAEEVMEAGYRAVPDDGSEVYFEAAAWTPRPRRKQRRR